MNKYYFDLKVEIESNQSLDETLEEVNRILVRRARVNGSILHPIKFDGFRSEWHLKKIIKPKKNGDWPKNHQQF